MEAFFLPLYMSLIEHLKTMITEQRLALFESYRPHHIGIGEHLSNT